ncbi:DUF3392 domain-containing protein [Psychrosphaera sp. B3R10]|uniref:DUF3392 domain-containing protein n=1 Tax=unclassified Psychrosphaera TaxID=2641570 RepID=UPI001C080DB4|nr:MULTISPECIES: DUF3392 domain-containing protein [unclassified Psychrosphaera]MBU2883509.1 DUF3392 domain-containing protein [Psychrosphaera sp. I2R16]MBU2989688.1 DUF3392 domain-containing protein [Psychrosphaera sp. B3R10]MDO6719871.1 DUF3392 domain-containing protein [Psychrosphaera sp. 1_MG-2023]
MDWVLSILSEFGRFMRPYSADISLGIVASILVICGSDINKMVRRQLGNAHFIIRTVVFVLVCTFGYGALTVVLTQVLKVQLSQLSYSTFAIVVLAIFIMLGIWAERRKQI